jgi:hypothetical protein
MKITRRQLRALILEGLGEYDVDPDTLTGEDTLDVTRPRFTSPNSPEDHMVRNLNTRSHLDSEYGVAATAEDIAAELGLSDDPGVVRLIQTLKSRFYG